jgi:hypothetical protein
MKGWPNRRRLLWGRRSLIKGLALPAALLLVVTVAVGFYLVFPLFSGSQNHSLEANADVSKPILDKSVQENSASNNLTPSKKTANQTSYRDILKIATVPPAFSVLINTSSGSGKAATYADLMNTGQDMLSEVKIAVDGGKLIGLLSKLAPGERKTLALGGDAKKANITAIDSSGNIVVATIHYAKPDLSSTAPGLEPVLGGGSNDGEDSNPEHDVTIEHVTDESCMKIKENSYPINSSQVDVSQISRFQISSSHINSLKINRSHTNSPQNDTIAEINLQKRDNNISDNDSQDSRSVERFNLTITTNKSEGLKGDSISYECTAVNLGKETMSNPELECGGKRTSTTYLVPGKDIHVNGSFILQDSVLLNATVKGNDTKGNVWIANATAQVRMISPDLKLNASAIPECLHRGDEISLSVEVKDAGKSSLSNITVSDSFGRIGQIAILDPGKSAALQKNRTIEENILDQVRVTAYRPGGQEIYGSARVQIKVFGSSLNLTAVPKEAVVYPGQPLDATWVLNNTGEEILKNITLTGGDSRYRLKEISPASSVRMSTIYVLNKSGRINVTAKGYDPRGHAVLDKGSILIRAISPGISLKVTPSDVQAFVGEDVNFICLVTNTGNDALTNVVLAENGDSLDRIDSLSPGEFHVFSPNLKIKSNSTIDFSVKGEDYLGRTWSASTQSRASLVTSSIKMSVKAPDSVKSGESARITCTLDNLGSVPVYNILANSKTFGPLGLVEYLAPKQQKTLTVDEQVNEEITDEIKAEGVTSTKSPVIDSCKLHISVAARFAHASGEQKPKAMKEAGSVPANKNATRPDSLASSNSRAIGEQKSAEKNNHELDLKAHQATIETIANPSTKEYELERSGVQVADNSSAKRGNAAVDEISGLVQYIKKMLEQMSHKTEAISTVKKLSASESGNDIRASKNYELAIESAKGSDHGRIKVMDVSASPPNPSSGSAVKITVHVQSDTGIDSALIEFGVKDTPITKMQMASVARIYTIPMTLESGDSKNGYWSCTIPGKAGGTYMVLSVALKDDTGTADDGPYMLHWSTVTQQDSISRVAASQAPSDHGMLYIESSVVRGTGEVSVKDAFNDNAIGYNGWMKGYGSINMESQRSLDKNRPMVNFTQRSDLVFEGGQLKGEKSLESPAFYGGIGASVTEKFNLSHVDKSETDMIRSLNSSDNTLAFNADQAFNGTWNIKTQYAQLFKKMKGDQQYSGSFQTQKKIEFQDLGKS